LERVRYEAERAERQYSMVEPENRLVARSLEKTWESKLTEHRSLLEEFDRHERDRPTQLTPDEVNNIRKLATNLPALWSAPSTTAEERKSIVRIILSEVRVTIEADSEWATFQALWVGGHETTHKVKRPVAKLSQLQGYDNIMNEVKRLRADGFTARQIAEKINGAGWRTPTGRSPFNERLIHAMLARHGFVSRGPRAPLTEDANEWKLEDLARDLEMPRPTLYGWMRRGLLKARRVSGAWIVVADEAERERLRSMQRRSAQHELLH
jgi:hypothetical protein